MKRVLIVGKIHEAGLALLRDHGGLEIEEITDPDAPMPVDKLEQSDALLIRTGDLSEDDIRHADRLRVVSRHGVGCDNVPVDVLSARGIPITTVGPVNAVSVAEQTMTMMLALTKRLAIYDQAVRNGDWMIRNSLGCAEISGKTLLLLGLGRIGSEVAKRACAFDMEVLVFDPFVKEGAAAAAGAVKVADWRAALGRVDVLSIHLPLTSDTHRIIDASALAAMKPTAIVINTARGGLVDEAALFEALSGRMQTGGAGLDTFENEPPRPDAPLLGLPNVVLSPHSAAMTEESARRMAEVAARNVVAGLAGKLDPALVFNLKALKDRKT